MARTKIRRRSYSGKSLREAENLRVEEQPQDLPAIPQDSDDDVFSPLSTADEPHPSVEISPVLNAPERITPTTDASPTGHSANSEKPMESTSPISLAQTSPRPGTSRDDPFREPQPSTSGASHGYWSKESSSSASWARPGCSKDKPTYDYDQPSTSYADRDYITHFRPHSPLFPAPGPSRDSAYSGSARTSNSYSLTDHEYMSSGSPLSLVWNSSAFGRVNDNPYIRQSRAAIRRDTMEEITRSPSPPVNLTWNSRIIVQPNTSRDAMREETSRFSPSPPLNLAYRDSSKENCQQQANASTYRPKTPDMNNIAVDSIFSPKTEKELRSSIRNLFPNGPPLQPVRPVRRPKKGDTPYIVGCTKRPRVPSPQGLSVFKGDQYGITDDTNSEEDYRCPPAKRNRRAPYGSYNVSKSRFNNQSHEIAGRLRAHENLDALLGRTSGPYMPRTSTTTSRSFSPLPSTSTDNETIMKNDRHFSASLNNNFKIDDIDDDNELPEVYWTSNSAYEDFDSDNRAIPLVVNKNVKEESKADDCNNLIVVEDANNNNNNNSNDVSGDYEDSEIEFDKCISKEKIIACSPEKEVKIDPEEVPKDEPDEKPPEPEVIDAIDIRGDDSSGPPRDSTLPSMTSSADVICIDDANTNNNETKQRTSTNQNESNLSTTRSPTKSRNSSEAGTSTSTRTSTVDTQTTESNIVIKVSDDSSNITINGVPVHRSLPDNQQNELHKYISQQFDFSLAESDNSTNSSDVITIGSTRTSIIGTRTTESNLVLNVSDEPVGMSKIIINGTPLYRSLPYSEQREMHKNLRQFNFSSTSTESSTNSADTEVIHIQSSTVINVPDDDDTSESTANQDVEFVCEITIDGLRYPFEPLQQELAALTNELANDFCTHRVRRRNRKRRVGEPIVINNENSEPTGNDHSTVELEIVDALPEPRSPPREDKSPKNGKDLGDCPICLDRLSTRCLASTNCGHVFCLGCIKTSLSTSGKKCPTCRKKLKGTGYHQVFL